MPNERLRAALSRAATPPADLAQAASVDVKTVERWLSGRTPFPRHRQAVADLLGEQASYLWPDVADERRGHATHRDELVAVYAHRSAVPTDLWRSLLERANTQVDVLAYAALFLPELEADLVERLSQKAKAGLTVRVALGDANSAAVRLRGEEEGIDHGMAARVRMSLIHLDPLADLDGVDVRLHGTTLYNSIFRFDDEVLVNTHLYGAQAYRNPVLHLRKVVGRTMFSNYLDSFDRVWARSRPYAR